MRVKTEKTHPPWKDVRDVLEINYNTLSVLSLFRTPSFLLFVSARGVF